MEKAMEILKSRTLEELVNDFESTTDIENENIYTVRGWIMDEIQKRNPEGYEKFIDDFREDSELRNFVL